MVDVNCSLDHSRLFFRLIRFVPSEEVLSVDRPEESMDRPVVDDVVRMLALYEFPQLVFDDEVREVLAIPRVDSVGEDNEFLTIHLPVSTKGKKCYLWVNRQTDKVRHAAVVCT